MENLKKAIKVPLKFHWSYLVLPILFIYLMGIVPGLIGCAILTASVLIHEYAHIWMALRQGVNVGYVIMMAIGAGAMIDQDGMIGQHIKELKVSLAGPAASFILSLLFFIISLIIFGIFQSISWILTYTVIINLVMGIFNLLPLYPMDGGRALTAILSMYVGGIKAVKITTIISYILGSFGVLISLFFGQWWLAFVLFIVVIMAGWQKKVAIQGYRELRG